MRHPVEVHVGADVERRTALSRSMAAADGVIVVSQYMRSLLVAAEPRLDRDLHVLSRPIRDLGALRPRHRVDVDRSGRRHVRRTDQRREGPRHRHRGARGDADRRRRWSCASPASSRTSSTGPPVEQLLTDGHDAPTPASPRPTWATSTTTPPTSCSAGRTSSPSRRAGRSRSARSRSKRWPPAPPSSPHRSAVSPTSSSTATTGSTPPPATSRAWSDALDDPPRAARRGPPARPPGPPDVTRHRHRRPRPRPRHPRQRLPQHEPSADPRRSHRELTARSGPSRRPRPDPLTDA